MSFSELGYCFMDDTDTEAMSRMNSLEPLSWTPVHATSQFGWQISTAGPTFCWFVPGYLARNHVLRVWVRAEFRTIPFW